MAITSLELLKTRRLGPLCLTQACGAFNDNMVKNALVVLALFKLGTGGTGLTALAGALIIAPFVLFSAIAGQIADRFSKPRVILIAKWAELLLMLGAAVAFVTENQTALLALLFGLGAQAAVLEPAQIRNSSRAPGRQRTGRGQRRDRGDHLLVDPPGHRRGRRAYSARQRDDPCRRGGRRVCGDRAVRGDVSFRQRRRPPRLSRSAQTCRFRHGASCGRPLRSARYGCRSSAWRGSGWSARPC